MADSTRVTHYHYRLACKAAILPLAIALAAVSLVSNPAEASVAGLAAGTVARTVCAASDRAAACDDGLQRFWWTPVASSGSLTQAEPQQVRRDAPDIAYLAELEPALRLAIAAKQPATLARGLVQLDLFNDPELPPRSPATSVGAVAAASAKAPAVPAVGVIAPSVTGGFRPSWGSIRIAGAAGIAALLLGFAPWLRRRASAAMRRADRWIDARLLGVRRVMTVEEVDPHDAMSQAAVERRGWSPEAMEALLGRPDYAVVDPQGLREPLILLSRKRVERTERTEKFRRYLIIKRQQQEVTQRQVDKWLTLREQSDLHPGQARGILQQVM